MQNPLTKEARRILKLLNDGYHLYPHCPVIAPVVQRPDKPKSQKFISREVLEELEPLVSPFDPYSFAINERGQQLIAKQVKRGRPRKLAK